MYYVADFEINTTEDVSAFFKHLVEVFELNFHPDTPFSDYFHYETKADTFTPEQCEKLDRYMEQCFEVCEAANVDIYELGVNELSKN